MWATRGAVGATGAVRELSTRTWRPFVPPSAEGARDVAAAGELPGDVLRFADVTLDEARHEVHRGGSRVDLTATEFALLRFFLLNPRRVLSKSQILQNVWRYDFGGNSNVVETYVSYLRKKLDALGPPLIRTIRQAGYMLETGE